MDIRFWFYTLLNGGITNSIREKNHEEVFCNNRYYTSHSNGSGTSQGLCYKRKQG